MVNEKDKEDSHSEWLDKFYTEKGVAVMKKRLASLFEIKSNITEATKYPYNVILYGFPAITVNSEEHLVGMIYNNCYILGINPEELINEVEE